MPPDEPGLRELLTSGMVSTMVLTDCDENPDHDYYTLSAKGRECVYQCAMLKSPQKILAYKRRGLPAISAEVDDRTTVELILALKDKGWSDMKKPMYSRTEPYKKNGAKVWYWSDNFRVSKHYLKTLVLSEQILATGTGISEIYHHQSKAYYKSLQMRRPVLPNQPLQYYKYKTKTGEDEPGDDDEYNNSENHEKQSKDVDDDACAKATILFLFFC